MVSELVEKRSIHPGCYAPSSTTKNRLSLINAKDFEGLVNKNEPQIFKMANQLAISQLTPTKK